MTWNMVGHDWATSMLVRHIQNGTVKHAYIFYGADGIGRRTLSLRFAQAIFCQNAETAGIPCQECSSCQRVNKMQHPDLFVVSKPENGKELRIDQMRTLQHDLSLAPYEAPVRIGLITDFENASESAQNAMLKTLEEPNPRVMLLLTASRPEDLLPTIVSRCEPILLRPGNVDIIASSLEKQKGIETQLASKAARLASGCYGYASYLADNPAEMDTINQTISNLLSLLSASFGERFAYAEEIAARKPNARDTLSRVLRIWLSFWRDVLIISGKAQSTITHVEYQLALERVARQMTIKEVTNQLNHIEAGMEKLDKNVNVRLLAEVLLLDLPHLNVPINP